MQSFDEALVRNCFRWNIYVIR